MIWLLEEEMEEQHKSVNAIIRVSHSLHFGCIMGESYNVASEA